MCCCVRWSPCGPFVLSTANAGRLGRKGARVWGCSVGWVFGGGGGLGGVASKAPVQERDWTCGCKGQRVHWACARQKAAPTRQRHGVHTFAPGLTEKPQVSGLMNQEREGRGRKGPMGALARARQKAASMEGNKRCAHVCLHPRAKGTTRTRWPQASQQRRAKCFHRLNQERAGGPAAAPLYPHIDVYIYIYKHNCQLWLILMGESPACPRINMSMPFVARQLTRAHIMFGPNDSLTITEKT